MSRAAFPNFRAVLNHILDHAVLQGAYGYDVDQQRCVYRLRNSGIKCMIGAVIADEDYTPTLENKSAVSISRVVQQNCAFSLTTRHVGFLQKIQQVHDRHATAGLPYSRFLEELEDNVAEWTPAC